MIDFDAKGIYVSFIIIYFLIFAFLKKKSKNKAFFFVGTLFYIYLVMVIKYTQFPIIFDNHLFGNNYKPILNLIPLFKLTKRDFITSILNVILFLPFGFLYFILSRFSYKKTLIIGFIVSFLIEIIQLCFSLITQVPFRVFDINDLIFNISGVFIGILCFMIFNFFANKITDIFSLKENELTIYILKK